MCATTAEPARVCLECRAELRADAATCWQCGCDLNAPAKYQVAPPGRLAFNLGSLMLFMTLASCWLGAFAVEPGLGGLILAITVPALFRTINAVEFRLTHGRFVGFLDKLLVFAWSVGVSLLAYLVGALAFALTLGVTMFLVRMLESLLYGGLSLVVLLLGMLATLAAGVLSFAGVFHIFRELR